jgi:hypothetical protein
MRFLAGLNAFACPIMTVCSKNLFFKDPSHCKLASGVPQFSWQSDRSHTEKALVRWFLILILSGSNALWPTQCTVTVTLGGPTQYCNIIGPPKITGMH